MPQNPIITIETTTSATPETAWAAFTKPEHITQWNFAIPEWHCPAAENDLVPGGAFSYTMAARDGSFQFDFAGQFTVVENPHRLAYTLGDGRTVDVTFIPAGSGTRVVEVFEAEGENPLEMQRAGWQAILDNFGRYAATLQ